MITKLGNFSGPYLLDPVVLLPQHFLGIIVHGNGSGPSQLALQPRQLPLQMPHQGLVGHDHVDLRAGDHLLGTRGEQEGVPRLLDVAPRRAHRADDRCPGVASQGWLQDPGQLGVPVGDVPGPALAEMR